MDPDITRFRKQPCPFCGIPLDAMAPPDGRPTRAPESGDFSLCIGCGEPAVYRVTPLGAFLERPTPEEFARFAVDHGDHAEYLRKLLDRL
jgi:hypothetical protein